MNEETIHTGALFRHFTGGEYVVLAVATFHSTSEEDNKQKLVIYQSKQNGSIWARPIEEFRDTVERNGVTTVRFEALNDFDIVTFDQYEELALRTANRFEHQEHALTYGGLGVGGESGEFQGALAELIELCLDALRSGKHAGNVTDYIKKVIFHDHALTLDKIENEQGDKLWYDNRVLHAIGSSLKNAAKKNILKLRGRYPNGFSKEASRNRAG